MSDDTTRRNIAAYVQNAEPTLFLSGMFQSPAVNFHNTEEVEIDVTRGQEEVAIVIQDISAGFRENAADTFTNKSFIPPIYQEQTGINGFKLLNRQAGQNPFQNPDFRANLLSRMFGAGRKIEAKIRRSMELQASQVLQTGIVSLIDSAGVVLYTIDYQPKATHNTTAGTAWDNALGVPLTDISALAEVIRNDGLSDPDQLIMGIDAYNAFISNPQVTTALDVRRIDQGRIESIQQRGEGGNFRGVFDIGNYRYEIFTYGGRFTHPQTGVATQYITPANCIVRASGGRLDATFGGIPNLGEILGVQDAASSLLSDLPARASNRAGGMDMNMSAWLSPNKQQLFFGAGARPLMIPTAIDTFGKIATGT